MAEPTISISPALASVIWDTPVETPPSGTSVNFTNPPGMWSTTVTAMVIQVIVIAIAITTRLLSTFVIRKKLLLEDLFIYTAFAFYLGLFIPASIGCAGNAGFGIDIWNMTYGSLSRLLYIANICEISYGFGLLFIKLAMLFHMKRLFAPQKAVNSTMWYTLWGLIVGHIFFYGLHNILIIAGCVPRVKIWDPIQSGTCINIRALVFTTATLNAVSDCAILLIPIVRVWRLQMAKSYKANLSLVFAFGFLGCICSILRAYYSWLFLQSSNITRMIYWMGFWSELELVAGFFASAVPFMPKCYKELSPRVRNGLGLRKYRRLQAEKLQSDSERTASTDPELGYSGPSYMVEVETNSRGPVGLVQTPETRSIKTRSALLAQMEKSPSSFGDLSKSLPPTPTHGYYPPPITHIAEAELEGSVPEVSEKGKPDGARSAHHASKMSWHE